MPYKDKATQNAYQMGYMTAVRKLWFEDNGPCTKCGSWENLELHHVNPAEKTSHLIWSWSAERRKAELAKCTPLCHDCHKAETVAMLTKPLVHGTANGYKGKRCRCDECRAWNANRMRNQLARKRANSSGQDRTADLSIMSGALSPSELRCPENKPFSARHSAEENDSSQSSLQFNDLAESHRHYEERGDQREVTPDHLLRANTEGSGNSPELTEHSAKPSANPGVFLGECK